WIRSGQDRRILLVGAEIQSPGLDVSTAGRDTAVIFGDGAGVAILGPTDDPGRGVLSAHLFSDGRHAEQLWMDGPGLSHVPWISTEMLEDGRARIKMEGREVFKHATTKMPGSVQIALQANGLATSDIKLLIAHQANLRISEMVQKQLALRDDQVFNNIQRYGNTTAASIPIALDEALQQGRLHRGELLVLTAFGSGFTWGSAAIRW
ncbi:MAG: 3-oxoacyl-ACP synthase III family protein, partial [Gemmatimonadales bacterium]